MRKTLTYILLLTLPFTCLGRSAGFSSSRLAALAAAAGLSLPENPSANRLVYSVVCQGRTVPVVVEYEAGKVAHIGVDLLGEDVKKEQVVVCRFVERYLLESLMDSHSRNWDSEPIYGRVVTQGDLFRILQVGPENRSVLVSMDGEGNGCVEIGPEPVFSIRFPAEIQLLSGKKKDELEAEFIREVAVDHKVKKREVPRNLKRVDRDLYVAENGFYEIESAQRSAFFRRKGLFYQPLCESSLPVESLMTLLTGFNRRKDYTVQAVCHQYGYRTAQISVPLDYLIDYCLDQGCVPYVGIESQTKDTVVATLFMVNRSLGYSHTFQFTVDTDMLDETAGTLSAKAYLFTPIYRRKS